MIALEDRIRTVLRCEVDAMHVPDAVPGERLVRVTQPPTRRRPVYVAVVAAAAAVVLTAGVAVLAQGRGDTPTVPGAPTGVEFHVETPTVTMDADSVEVIAADRTWAPTADLVVNSDPGMPNEYTTLELTWHDGGIEQRIYMYFRSDGVDWWAGEIRTYDGQPEADWVDPIATGEYFRSPLGTPFVGDLDLPNLHISGMTLEAFRSPTNSPNSAESTTLDTALPPATGAPVVDAATKNAGE